MDYRELMQQEIDGESGPEQSAELQRYLNENPAARKEFEELSRLSDLLSGLESVDPPEGLRESILDAVGEAPARGKTVSREIRLQRSWSLGLPALRFAFVFFAGLVLGALIYPLFHDVPEPSPDLSGLRGTMLWGDVEPGDRVVEPVPIEAPGFSGTLEIYGSGSRARLDLRLTAEMPVEVLIEFDPDRLRLEGIRQSDPEGSQLQASDRSVRWLVLGHNELHLLLRQPGEEATVGVRIRSSGTDLFQRSFRIGGG